MRRFNALPDGRSEASANAALAAAARRAAPVAPQGAPAAPRLALDFAIRRERLLRATFGERAPC